MSRLRVPMRGARRPGVLPRLGVRPCGGRRAAQGEFGAAVGRGYAAIPALGMEEFFFLLATEPQFLQIMLMQARTSPSGEAPKRTESGFTERPIYTGAQMLKTRVQSCHFLPLFEFVTGRPRGCTSIRMSNCDKGIGTSLGIFRRVEKIVANSGRKVAMRKALAVHYLEYDCSEGVVAPSCDGSARASLRTPEAKSAQRELRAPGSEGRLVEVFRPLTVSFLRDSRHALVHSRHPLVHSRHPLVHSRHPLVTP